MIHPPGVLQCQAHTKTAVCAAQSPNVLAAWKVLLCDAHLFPFAFHYSLAIQIIYL
jgi:hypothetical protein